MIRLRVSDLDSWLSYVAPPFEGMELSLEDLMARLERRDEPKTIMKAGSALHKILEHVKPGDEFGSYENVVMDGVRFRFEADHELALPSDREGSISEHTFQTPSGEVLLRGRIDGRERDAWRTVIDYKLSSSFDAERYARSMQWRAYSLMEQARRFRYLIFEAKQEEVRDEEAPDVFLDVWVHEVHEMVLWPYPEMEQDVKNVVAELAEFVVKRVPGLVRADPLYSPPAEL